MMSKSNGVAFGAQAGYRDFMGKGQVDIKALHKALDAKRKTKNLSWRDAAEEMGVSASTLTRMAQGASPDVDGFAKMVAWLGVSADDFIERGSFTKSNQKGNEDLLVVVSRNLRASKEFDSKSAQALENLIAAAYTQMKELKSK